MFWLGFLLGVAVTLPFVFEWRPSKTVPPLSHTRRAIKRAQDATWEQMHNFLYYDGTVMPTKEEKHE